MSLSPAHKSSLIVDQTMQQSIPPTHSINIEDTETCCTKQERRPAISKHPIHTEHDAAMTEDVWHNMHGGMKNTAFIMLNQATDHNAPPTPSINISASELCYTKNKQEKPTVIPKRPVYIEREAAMAEDSWYNTYVEMANKRERNILLQVDTKSSATEEQEALEMIRTYTAADLRANLLISQQELYMYHKLLEDIIEIRQQNKRLECLVSQLQQKQHQQLLRLEEKGMEKIYSMKCQMSQLKLEITESKDHEDRHNVDIRKVQEEKNMLEKQVEALRLKTISAVPSREETHSSQGGWRTFYWMHDQLLPSFSAQTVANVESPECTTLLPSEDDGNL
uniref:Uncharacterized protein n=1 Tax=Ditylum brightwellii TaxID=49249 RepID=A0A7S4VNU6_9STRA